MVNKKTNNYQKLINDLEFFINMKIDKYEALKMEALEDSDIEGNCSYALCVGHLDMLIILRDFLKQNNYLND